MGEIDFDGLSEEHNRDIFFRTLIRHLSGSLEEVVGLDNASGFISLVGQEVGNNLNQRYRRALRLNHLNRKQVGEVLVDLKARIGGDFEVVEENDDRLVLRGNCCPFGEKVINRPSMCMMTSNVFGVIAAQNLGYAKVELDKTIGRGNSHCMVVIHLNPEAAAARPGIEYFNVSGEDDLKEGDG